MATRITNCKKQHTTPIQVHTENKMSVKNLKGPVITVFVDRCLCIEVAHVLDQTAAVTEDWWHTPVITTHKPSATLWNTLT
jgi:hypothetical protein